MAFVFIKSRREPIRVSNERGRALKKLRFGEIGKHGEMIGKSDPHDDIDLGDWAGEIGQIKAVEIEKDIVPKVDKEKQDEERRRQEWLKLPPEKKALQLGWFKLAWSVRHNFEKCDPPKDVLDNAYKIQVEYFRKNPTAEFAPSRIFSELIPDPKAGSKILADKMTIKKVVDEIPA
jgi:hypothetical protein